VSEGVVQPQVELDEHGRQIYEPDGRCLGEFVLDNSEVAIIQGPEGSGKSKAARQRIWRHACEQAKSPLDGVRKTRWAVIRNTYPDLQQSVLKDWMEEFPERIYGRLKLSKPMEHHMRVGDVYCEVVFIALDTDEDVKKLKSTQWTGFYFNEVQYASRVIFDQSHGRAGRFPAVKDGGPTWNGVIADLNAPEDETNWLAIMTGQTPYPDHWGPDEIATHRWPRAWKFWMQPPALLEVTDERGGVVAYRLNPLAENRKWLPWMTRAGGRREHFYHAKARGKSKAWIDSRLMNRITIYADGSPVFPQFRIERHVTKEPLLPVMGHQVIVGLDFGRNPAAVFMQALNGRIYVQYELQAFDVSAQTFAPMVKQELAKRYGADARAVFWGDPKGRDKGQAVDVTPFQIFRAAGLEVRPAPVRQNNIGERLAAIDNLLERAPGGIEALVVSSACRRLKACLAGKYVVEKKPDSSAREPKKDVWADLPDAFGYGLLGSGEGYATMGRARPGEGVPRVSGARGRRSLRRAA
jgi:hypothetical protein